MCEEPPVFIFILQMPATLQFVEKAHDRKPNKNVYQKLNNK